VSLGPGSIHEAWQLKLDRLLSRVLKQTCCIDNLPNKDTIKKLSTGVDEAEFRFMEAETRDIIVGLWHGCGHWERSGALWDVS
jgi:hypothetical protein